MHAATHYSSFGSNQVAQAVGGHDVVFTPAVALLLGDTVFISAANTVSKSIVAGDQVKRVGVVVGGDLTAMNSAGEVDLASVGLMTVCTAVTGRVIVRVSGIAYAIADAALATAGTQLKLGATTAGRVAAATPATDAGKIVAMNLGTAAGAASVVKVIITLS
jgi:hypothetical protein